MRDRIERLLDNPRTVYAACAVSLALGLSFIFVWSPLPWGWHGIDFYYEIATSLAHGSPFPTMHIVWGYAYFLAFWYRLFGDHQWIPLVAQAVLNALIPLLLYRLVRLEFGHRVAVVSALVDALFSFNTVYTSTQAADAVCTVLVVAMMLCFALGRARHRSPGGTLLFAAAGLLAGLAFQFRPNLILFPFFAAALYLAVPPRPMGKLAQMATFIVVFALVCSPWVIRNYRWSGLFVPASTHGGVQLWFGTLQSGAYEDSWPYNPRAAFENPPLDYTSIDEMPLIVTATAGACEPPRSRTFDLIYWTNRDGRQHRAAAALDGAGRVEAVVPRQPAPTAVYYDFEISSTRDGHTVHAHRPAAEPLMIVVSRDHLGDLDVDAAVLDVFDIARMMRHVYWHEALQAADRLDFDRDGLVTERDIRTAVELLSGDRVPLARIDHGAGAASLVFGDGSTLSVPRQWTGRITDLDLTGSAAENAAAALLVSRSRPFAGLEPAPMPGQAAQKPAALDNDPCLAVDEIGVNRVPYRRLPHEMRRFTALAIDNIRHDPPGFLEASAHRALRVFVIEGSQDVRTAAQFKGARLVYGIAQAVSIAYLALFAAGLVIAIRRGLPLFMFLVPIAYVPLTISFMLINARYSMTIQPFVFAVISVALVAVIDAGAPRRSL